MSIYEKAAEVLKEAMRRPWEKTPEEWVQEVAAAVWNAIRECPQCDGKGHIWWTYRDHDGQELPADEPCSAEHVVMTNPHSGEERLCKPEMAEWRCNHGFLRDDCIEATLSGDVNHHCGWKPTPYEGNNE